MNNDFSSKVVKIGTITTLAAIIANFIPSLYLWLAHGMAPSLAQIGSILILCISTRAISWIVQPLSYYGGVGRIGSYISWIAGSAADIRVPAMTQAQEVAGVDASTPEGEAISAIGAATSVFVTVTLVTLFALFGSWLIPMLPAVITDSFVYMLPALFGAVYVSMAVKTPKLGVPIIVIGIACILLLSKLGAKAAIITLTVVCLSMLMAVGMNVSGAKKAEAAKKASDEAANTEGK